MDNPIMWVDANKGFPSATVARYGITLNSLATEIVSRFEIARIGYHKLDNALIFALSNLEDHGGKVPEGWILIKEKITPHGYFRLNNKDLVRVIAHFAGLDLNKKNRFMADWDEDSGYLVIGLSKKMETEINGGGKRRS